MSGRPSGESPKWSAHRCKRCRRRVGVEQHGPGKCSLGKLTREEWEGILEALWARWKGRPERRTYVEQVLAVLEPGGSLHCAEIARKVGLTTQQAANVLSYLHARGMLDRPWVGVYTLPRREEEKHG